jgi:pyrimidine operon attenuation protein/uracil phosphoribosyltransferase
MQFRCDETIDDKPSMTDGSERLCDADGFIDLIDVMARQIARGRRGHDPLRLVGIRDRGDVIAQRLARVLAQMLGQHVPVGAVDITLYRDDLEQVNRWPVLTVPRSASTSRERISSS